MTHDTTAAAGMTGMDRELPRRSVVIVGSAPSVVIPVARALAAHQIRCILAVPPNEHWRLRSRAIAAVVHLDWSRSDATSLLCMLIESERPELVLPVSPSALHLVQALPVSEAMPDGSEMAAELAAVVQPFLGIAPPDDAGAGGRSPQQRVVPWSWRDPAPTLQTILQRALEGMAHDELGRAIRVAWALPPGRRWRYLAWRVPRTVRRASGASFPRAPKSILFVCRGNMMRSAAAEAFMKAALASTPIGNGVSVGSAGTHARAGVPADERVRRAALEFGVSLDAHRTRRLARDIVTTAELIVAMDDMNVADILAEYPDAYPKVHLLGEIAGAGDGPPGIQDPYFASDDEVVATVRRIHASVQQLAAALVEGEASGAKQAG